MRTQLRLFSQALSLHSQTLRLSYGGFRPQESWTEAHPASLRIPSDALVSAKASESFQPTFSSKPSDALKLPS